MSVSMYTSQVRQRQQELQRLRINRADRCTKATQSSGKAANARASAARAKTSSSVSTYLRQLETHEKDAQRHDKEVSNFDKQIAQAEARLANSQRRLSEERAKVEKKRISEQEREVQAADRRMQSISRTIHQHSEIHNEIRTEIENMKRIPERIIVTFFAADPAEGAQKRLLLDEEVRSIEARLRASQYRDSVKLESRWAVRAPDILQAINELQPTIIHFSGHGSEQDELVLLDSEGKAKLVPMEGVVAAMALAADSVRLAFFNTCHSFRQAEACAEKVGVAVGMATSIGDNAAIIFSSQFYSAIGFGKSVQAAFDQAKALLMLEGIPESSTPRLYARSDVDVSTLTLVQPNAPASDI